MKNFVNPGKVMDYTAPTGGVTSGQALLIGALLVVSSVDADEGKTFAGHTKGVFNLEKATGVAFAEGDAVYFDATNGNFTNAAATGLYKAGVAGAVAATSATEAEIRLDGVSLVAEA